MTAGWCNLKCAAPHANGGRLCAVQAPHWLAQHAALEALAAAAARKPAWDVAGVVCGGGAAGSGGRPLSQRRCTLAGDMGK